MNVAVEDIGSSRSQGSCPSVAVFRGAPLRQDRASEKNTPSWSFALRRSIRPGCDLAIIASRHPIERWDYLLVAVIGTINLARVGRFLWRTLPSVRGARRAVLSSAPSPFRAFLLSARRRFCSSVGEDWRRRAQDHPRGYSCVRWGAHDFYLIDLCLAARKVRILLSYNAANAALIECFPFLVI